MLLKKQNQTRIFILKLSKDNIKIKKKIFLKKILHDYYNIDIKTYNIFYNKYGKPFIKDIYFNFSDTCKYIALIIGKTNVGIDIEQERIIDNNLKYKILNIDDIKNFNSKDFLLKAWVFKESFVKFKGTGIIDDFNKIKLEEIKKINHHINFTKDYYLVAFAEEPIEKNILFFEEKNIRW